jgi:mono/diheme cytochrome c family protein
MPGALAATTRCSEGVKTRRTALSHEDIPRSEAATMMAVIAILLVLLAGCAPAADRASLVKEGQAAFTAQGCNGCHTVGKTGTPIATDLTYVGTKYSEAQLRAWLSDPASQKPTAHMPKLTLTEAEITSLAAYLRSLR